jgi:hypothetical protein
MIDELITLYKSKQQEFQKLIDQFPEDDLAGPLLMSPSKKYFGQKTPLMVVGQETNGWTYDIDDIEKQMKTYEDFNLGINYTSSPFWNITRKLESALGNEAYSCGWTNISKFDLDSGRAFGEYEEAISQFDSILISEMKILKPKFCMFFTGPSFDSRIIKLFPGVEFIELPNWPSRQFCQLKHPDLPEFTFRSYHPKSLRLRDLENGFIDYIKGLTLK